MKFLIFLLLILILSLVIGWHVIFALVGGTILIGAGIWATVVISVVLFSAGTLFIFLFTGIGVLIIGMIFAFWTLVAIILFPILFPILLPLFIIFGFIAYMRRRQIEKIKH